MTASPLLESKSRGLICQQNEGFAGQCSGRRYTLLLAARELCWVVAHSGLQANPSQRLLDSLFSFRGYHSSIGQAQFNVFVNRQITDEIERLKDKADLAIAKTRALAN
jgi:hypothetical protein